MEKDFNKDGTKSSRCRVSSAWESIRGCENLALNGDLAEVVGAILGDGNLWTNGRNFHVTITGDPERDKEYIYGLATILQRQTGHAPYVRVRGLGLRLTLYCKKLFRFLTEELNIPFGRAKGKIATIPTEIRENPEFLTRFVRGLFDTDGTVFSSNKPGCRNYPSIEITSMNAALIQQVRAALAERGFRINVRCHKATFKLATNGREMTRKWFAEIGSSNPTKIETFKKIFAADEAEVSS